ncbi:MAG: hypothetical protein H7645_12385 [Candidatus Heimdallarchaeota archaeon]|nr:hypothetical protein [Candidatus Heimdallarchaeota archaeon]MCK4771123.1 hypothetical protein [Candidatus Heimdallarchaeota archaeon]
MNNVSFPRGFEDQEITINFNDHVPLVHNFHETRIDIKSLNEIEVTETIIAENKDNMSTTHCGFWINQTIRNLVVEDTQANDLDFDLISSDSSAHFITIYYPDSLSTNQTTSFKLIYYLDSELSQFEENSAYYSLLFRKSITYQTLFFRMQIELPENSFLHEGDVPFSYYPEETTPVLSGNKFHLVWEFENLYAYSDNLFVVYFDEPFSKTPPPIWLIIAGPMSGLITGAIIVFLWMKRKEKKAMIKLGTIFLTEDQKSLLKHLANHEGRMSQKEMITVTDKTKSKISRDLLPLEKYGLIKKEKWGREFRVYLTDSGERMLE